MMEARKWGDLAFHACDFAFDDCSNPHLPDVGLQPAWLRVCLRRGMSALQSEPPGGDSWLPMLRSTGLDFAEHAPTTSFR